MHKRGSFSSKGLRTKKNPRDIVFLSYLNKSIILAGFFVPYAEHVRKEQEEETSEKDESLLIFVIICLSFYSRQRSL